MTANTKIVDDFTFLIDENRFKIGHENCENTNQYKNIKKEEILKKNTKNTYAL